MRFCKGVIIRREKLLTITLRQRFYNFTRMSTNACQHIEVNQL